MRDVRNLLLTAYDKDYLQLWRQALGLEEILQECAK